MTALQGWGLFCLFAFVLFFYADFMGFFDEGDQ